jgi:hypothetical protein
MNAVIPPVTFLSMTGVLWTNSYAFLSNFYSKALPQRQYDTILGTPSTFLNPLNSSTQMAMGY